MSWEHCRPFARPPETTNNGETYPCPAPVAFVSTKTSTIQAGNEKLTRPVQVQLTQVHTYIPTYLPTYIHTYTGTLTSQERGGKFSL